MFISILHGISLGASTAIILGPVFFTLLKNALIQGKKAGYFAATGIIVSDLLVFSIVDRLSANFLDQILNSQLAYITGATILFILGIIFILKKIDLSAMESKRSKKTHFQAFSQGFLINFLNVFVFAIWLGFISLGKVNYTESADYYLYSAGILLGIYSTDLLKVYFANRLRKLLKDHHLTLVYKVIGGALILFAVRTLWIQMGMA